ncbi:hypothetical protein K493DRAFT_343144 [Basidiobolus meristosporus CBS 931.73]|uniref:Uncharacterized protein n=1 Tax=Basidiobolus meristosporus CBS 931.73 TaxID=1314790 RepID=A0A1Y1WNQ4_9FUNG|nr:hypothetical protein K493DRAFT_343144 [Basidiobolus meristosporus CBS 931.73]|eukprot:ORX75153.1 hypothetical protein K493DRAFT_343144 [Basidiobolus meristosporus CBS 931.73]
MRFFVLLLWLYSVVAVDVNLSFEDYDGAIDIRSIYSSLEVPVGYDPDHTYWCVAAWWGGYFGIQQINGSVNYITSVWNQGSKSARVDLGLPRGLPADCEDENYCIEGAVAHDLVYSEPWQTGVRYEFMVDCEVDGENEIVSSYILKNGAWLLISQFILPGFKYSLGNYVYQFLENPCFNGYDWEIRAETARHQKRGLYYNQQIRLVGADRWHRCYQIYPGGNQPGDKPHDEFYEALPMPENNGVQLILDGGKPGTEIPHSYSPLNLNTSNMEPPVPLRYVPKGKHTMTVAETYLTYVVITESPVTTTTTHQNWITNTNTAREVTSTKTALVTTTNTVKVDTTETQMYTLTPTSVVTELSRETQVVTEIHTAVISVKPRTITDFKVDASTVTIYETEESTVYAPAVTIFKD